MPFKNRILFFAALLFLSSCATKYAVVKANRDEYNINNGLAVDSSIIKTYLPYKVKLDAEMNKVIGYSDVVLTRGGSPESVLGNFYADAVLHQALKVEPNIDFVFPTTKGGLRSDIAKGPIILSSVFEMMPFENQLVLFELKGSDVQTILNYIAGANGQPVAGVKMNINAAKLADQVFIKGKAFDMNKNYKVLTSDYIASGGDDAKGFTTPISRKDIGMLVREALLKEVEQIQSEGKKINTTLDGRITKN